MKTYKCLSCGAPFTLGRGRPPLRPLCTLHKQASVPAEPLERPKNNRKSNPSTKPSVSPKIIPTAIVDGPPEIWGGSTTAITEPCGVCSYAYADGGYCPECGWSLPVFKLPWNTAGRKATAWESSEESTARTGRS